MSAYGKVTPEIVEKFKEIAPGRVYMMRCLSMVKLCQKLLLML